MVNEDFLIQMCYMGESIPQSGHLHPTRLGVAWRGLAWRGGQSGICDNAVAGDHVLRYFTLLVSSSSVRLWLAYSTSMESIML